MVEIISVILLLLILLPKIRITLDKSNYLTADLSTNVKGFLCILIFYNHLSGWFADQGSIFYIFSHIGSFVVGAFFFLSAFGLTKAYSGEVKISFLIKRFIKILVPYWICELIYIVTAIAFNITLQVDVTWKNIALSAIQLRTLVENSWYVGAILLLYAIFYICKKILPQIDLSLKVFIVMIFASFIFKNYWTTFFAFPLGILLAENEQFLLKLGKGKRGFLILVTAALCVCAIGLKYYGNSIGSNSLMNVSDMITSVLFAGVMFFTLSFVKIGNFVLNFLGKVSYEIYLLHGLALRIAFKLAGTEKPIAFYFIALTVTLILSYITNLGATAIIKPILKILRNKERNNEIHNPAS